MFDLVKVQDLADVFKILPYHQTEIVLVPLPAESFVLSEKGFRERPKHIKPLIGFLDRIWGDNLWISCTHFIASL